MGATLAPFLMFEGAAAEALELYLSVFEEAELVEDRRYGDDGPGAAGTVEHAAFRLGGQEVRLIDSPAEHAFDFTPAVSLFVELDSEEDVDGAFAALAEDGKVLMPLGSYPFSPRFGWLDDRFGVSWQLSVRKA